MPTTTLPPSVTSPLMVCTKPRTPYAHAGKPSPCLDVDLTSTERMPNSGDFSKDKIIETPWPIRHPTLGLQALLIIHQHVYFQHHDWWGRPNKWTALGYCRLNPLTACFNDLRPYAWGSKYSGGWGSHGRRLHPSPIIPWDLDPEYPVSVDQDLRVTWVTHAALYR